MPDVLLDHAIAEYTQKPTTLGLHDLLRVLVAACQTVERDHRCGKNHRRISPWSIGVGELGTVTIESTPLVGGEERADRPSDQFSVNQIESTTFPATEAPDTHAETAAYLAPELVVNEAGPGDPAAVVYSIGAILYRILTGQAPYVGSSREEILGRIRAGAPWPPSLAAPRVPFGLEAICLTAMEREPRERYASAAELARDLERWLAGVPLKAHYEEPPFTRMRRRLKGTLGFVVLGVFLGAALLALAVSINVIRTERLQASHLQGEFQSQAHAATAELAHAKVYADRLNNRHAADAGEQARALTALKEMLLKSQPQEGDTTTVQLQKEDLRQTALESLSPLKRPSMPPAGDEAAVHNRIELAQLFLLLEDNRTASYLFSLSAQAIRHRGPQEHPATEANPAAEDDLRAAEKGKGIAESRLGNLESAREAFRQALPLAEALAKANPSYFPLRQEITRLHELIGDLSLQLFDLPAARASFEKLRTTVEEYPPTERATAAAKLVQGVAFGRLAEVAFAEHRYPEALSWCRRSLEVLQPLEKEGLLKDRPTQRNNLRAVENMSRECAIVLKAIDDLGFALSPPSPNQALIVLTRRGEALARARKFSEALDTAERLRKLAPRDGDNLYNVAWILAMSGATRPALDALREAIDCGFVNGNRLKKDPGLEALRGEEEYRRILKRLEMWRTLRSMPNV